MRKAKSNAMLRGLASTALVLLISATAWPDFVIAYPKNLRQRV